MLLVLALTSLVVSLARPAHATKVPRERATVMLAIDVSNSMAATDVSPTRLIAAKQGAQAFIDQLPARINLGLVSFSGTASVQVEPTRDRQAVRQAINALELGPSTAIGEGVFACLQAIKDSSARLRDAQGLPPARIVLLSDGSTSTGRSNDQAAQAAKAAKTPVDTIAYGTQDGSVVISGRGDPGPGQRRRAAPARRTDRRHLSPGDQQRRVARCLSRARQLDRLPEHPQGDRRLVHRHRTRPRAGFGRPGAVVAGEVPVSPMLLRSSRTASAPDGRNLLSSLAFGPLDARADIELRAAGITDPELRQAFLTCRRINAATGRTFYLSTLLLPPGKRPYVHALYGFARYADDLVDDLAARADVAERATALQNWAAAFPDGTPGDHDPTGQQVIAAVRHTMQRWQLPRDYFEAFLRSMRMDLTVTEYATWDDLLTYTYGSAAVIGLQMLPILGADAQGGRPLRRGPRGGLSAGQFHPGRG